MLRAWSGLGYNRRALALQRAAAQVADHGWPDDLQTLPGVGPYTAAAVASFAFGAHVAAVDTNWRRVERRYGSAPPPEPDRQPGDDGARRHGLHGPPAALRGLSP